MNNGTWGANANTYGTNGTSNVSDGGGGGGGGGGNKGGVGGPVRSTQDANGNPDRRGEGGERGANLVASTDVAGVVTTTPTRTDGQDGEITLELVTATIT